MDGDSPKRDYPAAIQASIKTRWLGQPSYYYATVTSTNDVLADLARDGAPAGAMVVTDYQSQGKGRLGRRWLAPAGTSLLLSLLFRPNWPPERAAWLTMIAGLAALETVASLSGLSPRLKWPNDLMLPAMDRWLKVGGILLEGQLSDGQWAAFILGIGINVNIEPEHIPAARWPATSLLKETGRVLDRVDLLNRLLVNLERGYEAAVRGTSPREAWERELLTLGKQVTILQVEDSQPLTGIAVRTDEWGRLVVRDRDGREHPVSAGDVTQVDNSWD